MKISHCLRCRRPLAHGYLCWGCTKWLRSALVQLALIVAIAVLFLVVFTLGPQ